MDYGISNYVDEKELYVRHCGCSVLLRVRPYSFEARNESHNGYQVDLSEDSENWQTVYHFNNEDDAEEAMSRLANFILDEAAATYLQKPFKSTLKALLSAADEASKQDFAILSAGAYGSDKVDNLYKAAKDFVKIYSAKFRAEGMPE